jgi:hypothetical protein
LRREIAEELPQATNTTVHELLQAHRANFLLKTGYSLLLLFYRVELSLPNPLHLSAEHDQLRWATAAQISQLPSPYTQTLLEIINTLPPKTMTHNPAGQTRQLKAR